MNLSIIAAIGKNNELGKDNDLIWRFKDDMKFFKETTMGHKMIMGRKTVESLPKVLPGRHHIVLTRSFFSTSGNVEIYHSPLDFLEVYKYRNEEIFNIGESSIYKEFIDYADKLYLTEIDDSKEADVYFPEFDKNLFDREVLCEHEEDGIGFKHVLYKRRKLNER